MTQETPVPSFGARASALLAAPSVTEKDANPAMSQADRINLFNDGRIPMSTPQAKLATPSVPGHNLHWMNDYPGRINQALAAGYDFVTAEETHIRSRDLAGDATSFGSTDMGSRVSLVVGADEKGEPLRAYLMKIREEWRKADEEASQRRNDQIDEAMRQGNQVAATGKGDAASRYVKTINMKSTYSKSS